MNKNKNITSPESIIVIACVSASLYFLDIVITFVMKYFNLTI